MDLTVFMLDKLIVNRNILEDERYKYIFSVDVLNKLVSNGIPFRDAYKEIGKEIKERNI